MIKVVVSFAYEVTLRKLETAFKKLNFHLQKSQWFKFFIIAVIH